MGVARDTSPGVPPEVTPWDRAPKCQAAIDLLITDQGATSSPTRWLSSTAGRPARRRRRHAGSHRHCRPHQPRRRRRRRF